MEPIHSVKSRHPLLTGLLLILAVSGLQIADAQQNLSRIAVNQMMFDVVWSPNGERLAVAVDDEITIYTGTLQEIAALQTGSPVAQISWSDDSNRFASIGQNDPTAKVWRWDANTNAFVLDRTLTNGHGYSYVSAVAWSPNGDWLALLAEYQPPGAAYLIGVTEIWDTQTWTVQNSLLAEHEFPAQILKWSSDSQQIAGAASACISNEYISCDHPYFYIADAVSGELNYRSRFYMPDFYTLAWSGDTKLAIANAQEIMVFDTTINQPTAIFPNRSPIGGGTLGVDWSSDGKRLVTAYHDEGLIEIIDTETGVTLLRFSTGGLNGADLSPDDSKLATINSADGLIEIWDVS